MLCYDQFCGGYGRVLSILDNGDLKVLVENSKVTINPTACEPVDDQKIAKKAPQMPSGESDDEDVPMVGGRTATKTEQQVGGKGYL